MPLLPQVVGSVEVRERRPRYAGEPRYKRMDFVRSKKTTEVEEWELAPPQHYLVTEIPAYRQPYTQMAYQPQAYAQVAYEHPQHQIQSQAYHDTRMLQGQQYYTSASPVIPVSPSHGQPSHVTQNVYKTVESHPAAIDVGPAATDDDIMYTYLEPKKTKRRSIENRARSKSRTRPKVRFPKTTNSVHSTDADDNRRKDKQLVTSPQRVDSKPAFDYDSDDSLYQSYKRDKRRSSGASGW